MDLIIMKNTLKQKIQNTDWFAILGRLVIIGAFMVVAMIAMLSEFGVHPDEGDVKLCLDWGMNHWIWPDMRASGLGDTYSWYGYTKVCNYTPYFLIMGKIAYVFKQIMTTLPYFRVPNLLLMLIIVWIMLKNLKSKRYLLLAFGVCVQAWYIFSYVTADALDFVWAFLAIYLLCDDDSMLWNTVNPGKNKNIIRNCILLGLLYGMMLLGKPYYYATMFLTFVVLLIHLIKSDFDGRKIIWKRYILILLVCGLVFGARFGLDLHYYGTDKAQVEEQMAEIYLSDDKKPGAEPSELNMTYHMASKGYPLSDLFKYDDEWFQKSYRSFVSARMLADGNSWYFYVMGLLFIAIYVWIALELRRDNPLILITGTLIMIGGVVASVMNSYLIDSQPQGRYLLPIALTMCYMSSRVSKLWKNKWFCTLVLSAACLSIMYFGLIDSRKLIDLAYVKAMLAGR